MLYLKCLPEGIWLTSSRHDSVWLALTELAKELYPEKSEVINGWMRKHVANEEEAATWTEIFHRVKDMPRRALPFEISKYYTPMGIDMARLSKDVSIDVERLGIMLKKYDKPSMVSAVEEVLTVILHSQKFSHEISAIRV